MPPHKESFHNCATDQVIARSPWAGISEAHNCIDEHDKILIDLWQKSAGKANIYFWSQSPK